MTAERVDLNHRIGSLVAECADALVTRGWLLATAESFSFPIRPHTVFRDSFTPRTIERFTGHRGGAVYGSPRKARDGFTSLRGLELIGTDQGLVGVIGAMLSGITIANRSLLEPAGGAA